ILETSGPVRQLRLVRDETSSRPTDLVPRSAEDLALLRSLLEDLRVSGVQLGSSPATWTYLAQRAAEQGVSVSIRFEVNS
ncbi:hypothetical protein ACYOEI_23300, partial [Singulisphaera rosea]